MAATVIATDVLRTRQIAEAEAAVNAWRERKKALLDEAGEAEREEHEARKLMRLLREAA